MASEWARVKASAAWCTPETQHLQFDSRLAEAFANILDQLDQQHQALISEPAAEATREA